MAKKGLKYKNGICAYCGDVIPIRKGRLYVWCSEGHRSYFFEKRRMDRLNSKHTIISLGMSILRGVSYE